MDAKYILYTKPKIDTAGIIAHYKLDHSAFDYSLNGNDGTLAGTDIAPAYPGYSFNGTDDHIVIPDNTDLDVTNKFSVFAWVKSDSVGTSDGIVTKYLATGELREWSLILGTVVGTDAPLSVTLGNDGGTGVTTETSDDLVISNGKWVHVGFRFLNGAVWLYVNGVKVDSNDETHISTLNPENVNLEIGRFNGNTYFDGTIDDVMIFNTNKSAEDIKSIYEITRGRYSV